MGQPTFGSAPRPLYVLVTPARNEEATLGETIRSVTSQTWLPEEWIIVSDASTDRTDEIVLEASRSHPLIRLLRLESRPARNFASCTFATESGVRALGTQDFEFIGLLDADVRFKADYFESLIGRFLAAPRLGLAGGLVVDINEGKGAPNHQYLKDVAGAVQFFRRSCYFALGGLIAIPEGGWDAITNVQVRAQGFDTCTFPDLWVDHLKPRNSAEGGSIRRKWQLGVRDYALGYGGLFETAKCLRRWRESPMFAASLARLCGFWWSTLRRRPRALPQAFVRAIREEQKQRLFGSSKTRENPVSMP